MIHTNVSGEYTEKTIWSATPRNAQPLIPE